MDLRFVQTITCGLAILSTILCVVWMAKYPDRWRYAALAGLAASHTAAYYVALLVVNINPYPDWLLIWGAAHRLHLLVAIMSYPALLILNPPPPRVSEQFKADAVVHIAVPVVPAAPVATGITETTTTTTETTTTTKK